MRLGKVLLLGRLILVAVGGTGIVSAGTGLIPLSNFPVLLEEGVPPNVIISLDDSGSMEMPMLPLVGKTTVTDPDKDVTPDELLNYFHTLTTTQLACLGGVETCVENCETACTDACAVVELCESDCLAVCETACGSDEVCKAECPNDATYLACAGLCASDDCLADCTDETGACMVACNTATDCLGDDPNMNDVVSAYYSSHVNALYYNPDITYDPPLTAEGNLDKQASYGAAWEDGYKKGATVNLGTSYSHVVDCELPLPEPMRPVGSAVTLEIDCLATGGFKQAIVVPTEAFYYKFIGGAGDDAFDIDNYEKVTVKPSEQQNFANWYSYYRTRMLLAKTAMSKAFAGLIGSVRLGYQAINDQSKLVSVKPFEGTHRKNFFSWLRGEEAIFSQGTPLKTALINVGKAYMKAAPYRDDPDDSTSPARSCRANYHLLFTDGAWDSDNPFFEAFNDTNYDEKDGTAFPASNYTSFSDITSYPVGAAYPQTYIYTGDFKVSLADYAFYYWVTDLCSGGSECDKAIDATYPDEKNRNDVPERIVDETLDMDDDGSLTDEDAFWNPHNDPARWQHMVTHTIGFGVDGTLTFPDDETKLLTSKDDLWGNNLIDDLWHASINSRGRYFNVKKPEDLVDALTEVTAGFNISESSAASLSVNSGTLYSGSLLFQATFNTDGWTGDVIAYSVSSGTSDTNCPVSDEKDIGKLCEKWHAATKLDAKTPASGSGSTVPDRQIITFQRGTGGVAFTWTNVEKSAYQKDALNGADGRGSDRLDYLRGDRSNEQAKACTDCSFRDRDSILGDIVDAAPLYVGPPGRIYSDSSYQTFRDTTYKSRTPMLYAGANDGMLHVFQGDLAGQGEELLAYVPNEVFTNLASLTDTNYDSTHRFFVDGPLNEGDVQVGSGGDWKTLLAGGLGKGGQAVFALNITNPVNTDFTESKAGDLVFWEFSDADDADLGYIYAKPAIARIPGSKWAVIFGNGYDNTEECPPGAASSDCQKSTTGNAAIYLVYVGYVNTFTSGDFVKVPITATDPTSEGRANGVAAVTVVDTDSDLIADVLYAGDLFGNVWRVPLSTSGTPTATKVFTATHGSGSSTSYQPITTKIRVMRHPRGVGYLLLFGTGKYLGQSDAEDKAVQSFYGIWDDGVNYGYTQTSLQQQKIIDSGTHTGDKSQYRVTTDYGVDWTTQKGWYLNLVDADGTAEGERIMWDPELRDNRIMFVSVLPHSKPCQSEGADSWVNVLDARDGSRLKNSYPPIFDADLNGEFNENDVETLDDGTKVIQSSIKIGTGKAVYTAPSTIASGSDKLINYFGDSTGGKPVKLLESSGLVGRVWMDVR